MSFIKDRDYQSETTVLYAYWEGFHDPHSPIQEYFVSVGTCQSCDNVLGRQALGIAEGNESVHRRPKCVSFSMSSL